MAQKKPTVSDLLALRDGEPLAADVRAAIAADIESEARMARLHEIKAALNGLPDAAVVPDGFEQLQQRLARGNAQPLLEAGTDVPTGSTAGAAATWQLRYPMATAAGVFFAAVLVSLLWLPQLGQDDGGVILNGPIPAVTEADVPVRSGAMADLIDRSQRLEAVARLPVARAIDGQERSRQALLYRIADLDAQLNALIEEEAMDPALKEKLWRQRVDLLETLVAVQQAQLSAQAPDLY